MKIIANRDLPTLGVKKDQLFTLPLAGARKLLRQQIVRRPPQAALVVAPDQGPLPVPLAGSPTGAAKPASSSGQARAPRKPASKRRAAKPKS